MNVTIVREIITIRTKLPLFISKQKFSRAVKCPSNKIILNAKNLQIDPEVGYTVPIHSAVFILIPALIFCLATTGILIYCFSSSNNLLPFLLTRYSKSFFIICCLISFNSLHFLKSLRLVFILEKKK